MAMQPVARGAHPGHGDPSPHTAQTITVKTSTDLQNAILEHTGDAPLQIEFSADPALDGALTLAAPLNISSLSFPLELRAAGRITLRCKPGGKGQAGGPAVYIR